LVQSPTVASQLCVPFTHSSTSAQFTPSPEKPASHAHAKVRFAALLHVAFTWQLSSPSSHRPVNVQLTPSPV